MESFTCNLPLKYHVSNDTGDKETVGSTKVNKSGEGVNPTTSCLESSKDVSQVRDMSFNDRDKVAILPRRGRLTKSLPPKSSK